MKTINLTVLVFAALGALTIGAAVAAPVGEIVYIAGTLSAQKPDGTVKILSRKSEIEVGDVLSTEKDSYVQINFADKSQATLRPNSRLKIDAYHFNEKDPERDNLLFSLLKGGLRTLTGLIGKRGNQDAYRLKTATASIGIRGSSGDTLECSEGCAGVTSTSDKLSPGVYHATYTGAYIMSNERGSQLIGEGQFGFVKDAQTAPVILTIDPGMGLEAMPFSLGVRGAAAGGGAGQNECVMH
ncbi:MAG: FecR family protein [Gallionella sp.]|nr:FecR family protein [Gallionella sp.]